MDFELIPADVVSHIKINLFGKEIFIEKGAKAVICGEDKLLLDTTCDVVKVKMIVDKCTVEVVGNSGMYMTLSGLMNYNQHWLRLSAVDGCGFELKKLSVTTLE